MRKYTGLLVALILLALPAFASAGQLTVKVTGGVVGTNYVSLSGGVTKASISSGTTYYYPSTTTTITVNGAGATVTASAGITGTGPYTYSGSTNESITVAYSTAVTTGNVTFTQPTGATIFVKMPNGTFVSSGPTLSLPAGTVLPVTILPNSNYTVTAASVNVTGFVASAGPGLPATGSLTIVGGANNISATTGFVAKNTVSLKTVGSGYAGQVMTVTATSTSNDSGAQIAFTVTGAASGSQAATLTNGLPVSFSFTPSTTGTAVVTATASSANGGSVSTSANIAINSAAAAANNICLGCHNSSTPAIVAAFNSTVSPAHMNSNRLAANVKSCETCHSSSPHDPGASCVGCHSIAQNAGAGFVQDNSGVRSITQEFGKWSHHVTGVTLNDAHCAACHLEGKAQNGAIVVDPAYHMATATTHLRNAHDDSDMEWDPANPNFTHMDNFCMSCHSAAGATSTGSVAIQAVINSTGITAAGKTASPQNPFGDTISNRYDKMQRPKVTNVDDQFNTGNNSHHAVKGPRYTGRTRKAGSRQIHTPATFANNSSALLQGVRQTIYDAGNLNQLYTPLENATGESAPRTGAATLGDDSTLHCGDCHTVGQWKVGSSETANGSPTPVAIGAHGSNNEYLLRNNIGTDERHTQNAFLQGNITGTVLNPVTNLPLANGEIYYTNPNGAFLVCYNCHNYSNYGSLYLGTGLNIGPSSTGQPHAGEYDAQGRCNGVGNTIPFNGYTTGTATDGSQFASRFMGPVTKYSSAAPYTGEQNPDFGNIFGIQCLNCHNSGIGNAYGGIHGSANDTSWNNGTTEITPASLGAGAGGYYINGMGNAAKVERFLPGLGDIMHVPGTLGGVTGGTTFAPAGTTYTIQTGGVMNDTNWEQRHWQQQAGTVINNTTGVVTGNVATGAGCYTLGATTVTGAAIITSDMSSGLEGPSVTGEGGPATEATDTWGGCDDHTAGQGKGNHGFLKRIIRPVTY